MRLFDATIAGLLRYLCCWALLIALPACDPPQPPIPDSVTQAFDGGLWSTRTLRADVDPVNKDVYVAARCQISDKVDTLYVAKLDRTGQVQWEQGHVAAVQPDSPGGPAGPAQGCYQQGDSTLAFAWLVTTNRVDQVHINVTNMYGFMNDVQFCGAKGSGDSPSTWWSIWLKDEPNGACMNAQLANAAPPPGPPDAGSSCPDTGTSSGGSPLMSVGGVPNPYDPHEAPEPEFVPAQK